MCLAITLMSLLRCPSIGQEAGLPSKAVSPAPRHQAETPFVQGTRCVDDMAHEVDAFSSVQDMIHAAILSYGTRATLREVGTRAADSSNSCNMLVQDNLCHTAQAQPCCVDLSGHQAAAQLL